MISFPTHSTIAPWVMQLTAAQHPKLTKKMTGIPSATSIHVGVLLWHAKHDDIITVVEVSIIGWKETICMLSTCKKKWRARKKL